MVYPVLDDKLQGELDCLMQKGYDASENKHSETASNIWDELWKKIKESMEQYDISSMEKMDEAFCGQQFISNWATDFEMELYNAASEDEIYLQKRIDFCREYNARSEVTDDQNDLVRERVIAETYFKIGNAEEGERLFKAYVQQYPKDGWGWINWSDQYWLLSHNKDQNYEKAIAILKQALNISGLEEKSEVLNRLVDLYKLSGLTEEASDMELASEKLRNEEKMMNEAKLSGDIRNPQRIVEHAKNSKQIVSKKVGRNDPCPCGSGKKYKKCCGK